MWGRTEKKKGTANKGGGGGKGGGTESKLSRNSLQ